MSVITVRKRGVVMTYEELVANVKEAMKMLNGVLLPMVALTNDQLEVYGDEEQLKVLPFGCECKAKK